MNQPHEYEVEILEIAGDPLQVTRVTVTAWSAEDAVFQADFNICGKSLRWDEHLKRWVRTSKVYHVKPKLPE